MTIQKVLVVDDSKTELMALSDILQKQGMQVRTAENGEEAMKRLAEDKKRAERERQEEARRAAHRATQVWRAASEQGDCDYLHGKAVRKFMT